MLQMVSGGLIYFLLYYLLFTVSSVGQFLPMSSDEYKKGFVQVYLFFLYLPVLRVGGGDCFHRTREK